MPDGEQDANFSPQAVPPAGEPLGFVHREIGRIASRLRESGIPTAQQA